MREEIVMKNWQLVNTLVLLMALLGAVPTNAQGVVNVTVDSLQLDDFPTTEVRVTVRNENGVPIPDLEAEDFEVIEDGRSSFPPSQLTAQTNPDAVISVVMVIDISGSMRDEPIEEAVRAANALIDQLSPQDRAAVIAFADEVDIDPAAIDPEKEVAFTTDKNALRNVVNFLDQKIGWDTPLYDAIYKGVKMAAVEPAGKRAVVVMTDGRDERDNAQGVAVKDAGSQVSPDDPINEANRHNIPIFTVGLEGLGGKMDAKYLNRVAERTGGIYQQTPEPEELTPLFENVVNQLKQQYVLSFQSRLDEDDIPHSLLVRVQLPQGQAFDEVKFRIREPVAAPTSAGVQASSTSVAEAETMPPPAETEAVAAAETLEAPDETASTGLVQQVTDMVQQNPALAAVIAAGIVLLLVLLIALAIVLLRGPRAEEVEYASREYEPTYGMTPDAWSAETAGSEPSLTEAPTDAGWDTAQESEGAPSAAPFAPPKEPGAPVEAGFPQAGGTRIIERGPRHMAMLVSKSSSQKHDLQTMTNIGRAQDNHIVLDNPTVSRHHAWIRIDGDDFVIFDIGSGNGTFVNDERVEEPRRLEHGDVVRFGEAAFTFARVPT
jgi:VWFA-related protein